ncbi:MAG: histidine kinase dimerization/phospho-acceptor domain-containing protein [Bacteroidales bacterium]
MEENPTYEELMAANQKLKQKVQWLEGIYNTHREAGIQVKSRFLSNISHEIRTPMNAILGFSDLLKSSTLSELERDEYLQYISYNSQTLLKVMDNIIDLTLLETNNLDMKEEEIFAEDMFREIYEFYNSKVVRTMHYRVALLMTTPARYGRITVEADGYRLHRILDNLVTNAITQQTKGVIEMRMDIEEEKRVVFTVISERNELLEERAKMIFENNGTTDDWHNHLDSTGLAYKLARDLATAMGGAVRLVKLDEKRIGIRIDLPVKNIGIIKKKGSNKNINALLN